MIRHPLVNFIFGSLLGLMVGAGLTVKMSQPAIAHAQAALQDQAETIAYAQVELLHQAETIRTLQEQVEGQKSDIATLLSQLEQARGNHAAKLLAKSGHVMNEAQCREWIGVMAPPARPAGGMTILAAPYVATVPFPPEDVQ